jgi:hypothetical protein
MPEDRPGSQPPEADGRLNLTPNQRTLHRAFLEKDPSLAQMYLGGLAVLNDSTNPDSLALAAHAFRELIEKLPAAVAVPATARRESLRVKVREVQEAWRRAQDGSRCHSDGKWSGEVDKPLRKLLLRLAEFFAWVDAHLPRRREEIARALQRLDVSGRALPEPLQDLNVEAWTRTHEYFQAVAHHGKVAPRDEFTRWVSAAEAFFLDRLKPRTFEDFASIDELIREGESGAQS